MNIQLDIFNETKIEFPKPEPLTTVRLGKREAKVPLRRQRREALARLEEILKELEGKDVYIGSYDIGGGHYWIDNLLLRRLQVEHFPRRSEDSPFYSPGVIVLRGSRAGQVRIFTEYLTTVREQDYQGYWHYLLDFRNGFWDSKLDEFRVHYSCLMLTRFKD